MDLLRIISSKIKYVILSIFLFCLTERNNHELYHSYKWGENVLAIRTIYKFTTDENLRPSFLTFAKTILYISLH